MSSTLIWKEKKLQQKWIFLRNRCPKSVKLDHFRSISKNGRNWKKFWPISLQNPTQGIFSFIKIIVSPLLLPLLLIFSSENGQFKCKSKNGRNLKNFWSISLQYPTQAIFSFIKKIVTPLLFAALGDLWEKRSGILIEYPHELSNPFAWYNYVHIYVNHACVGLSNSPLFSRSIQFG